MEKRDALLLLQLKAKHNFQNHLLAFLFVNVVLWCLFIFTKSGYYNYYGVERIYIWPAGITIIWGIGVAMHWSRVKRVVQ